MVVAGRESVRATRVPWPAAGTWALAVGTWVVAVGSALAATIRVLGFDQGWLLVQLIAFTPYAALGSLAAVAIAGIGRRWWALGVAGLAALVLIGCVMPRALRSPGIPAAEGQTLVVMSANLWLGKADSRSIVDIVRDAHVDILVLQEYTAEAEGALLESGLAELLPYREAHRWPASRGSAVYARLPLSAGGVRVAAPGSYAQAYATITMPGVAPFVIESVHPVPPIDAAAVALWRAGLRGQIGADVPGPRRILAGDFNATLDHGDFRSLLNTGYRDAAAEVGAGFTATWPYNGSRSYVTPRIALDHLLVPAGVGVRDFRAVAVENSDHRAILVTITI